MAIINDFKAINARVNELSSHILQSKPVPAKTPKAKMCDKCEGMGRTKINNKMYECPACNGHGCIY